MAQPDNTGYGSDGTGSTRITGLRRNMLWFDVSQVCKVAERPTKAIDPPD
ncbi:hypothetical protein C8F01DRAFT_1252510 [Mycena amicta]|nr:hypothetical protein C8F01DRAFT_1252510 [Mycena amicta]